MRIVLDTNVLVSALLFGGIPQEIIDVSFSVNPNRHI